jgi:hypothetical protein
VKGDFLDSFPNILGMLICNFKRGIRAAMGPLRFFLELALAIGVLTCQVKGLDFQQGRCG